MRGSADRGGPTTSLARDRRAPSRRLVPPWAVIAILAGLICLPPAGCAGRETRVPERSVSEGEPVARQEYDPGDLAGSAWSLRRLYGDELVRGSRITLRFERDAIAGYTGCNAFRGGQLQTGGGAFMTPGPEISLVPCTGELGEQQGRFLTALYEAATYERTATELRINDLVGETTLLFDSSEG